MDIFYNAFIILKITRIKMKKIKSLISVFLRNRQFSRIFPK